METRKPGAEFSKRNNWWYYPPEKGGAHPAVFPVALVRDHILSWSQSGERVYDPFLGSGTTAYAAASIGRIYIGSEISEAYFKIAQNRLASVSDELLSGLI